MKSNEYKLTSKDNQEFHVYEWLPSSGPVTATLQIAHGMAEHAQRYSQFAEFLTGKGFAVYANDHRGHGKTAGAEANTGFFAEESGWDLVVADMEALSSDVTGKHAGVPFFIMGHSMGSFLVRRYIMNPPVKLSGAILSATAGSPGLLGHIGVLITKILMIFNNKKSRSNLMDKMSFGAFNNQFKPNRTTFDWLSRDDAQVDKYIADPYCGFVCTLQFFNDMLNGLLYVSGQGNIDTVAADLPVFFFAGENDPVGNNGKGVKEVFEKFKKAGIKDVELKLFPGGRHEMINETNRDEVYQLLSDWMRNRM